MPHKKMQKLQIWYGYIKKWWSENFISFLLCVWLAQFCPRRLDLFFLTERFFLFNLVLFFYIQVEVLCYCFVYLLCNYFNFVELFCNIESSCDS